VQLDNGADINSKTNNDKTALHYAVEKNSVQAIQLMLWRASISKPLTERNGVQLLRAVRKTG
jgi:ankyrin repeat protein